eukprot:TRINITY_DN13024_c0_g1_i1.p1 TRINITY_DN13024_c0_g1~~TRINITY_DN13024_c0_g1_i1.p1  ORF type:complete len:120 (+),score=24.37 TRINITY_DN13024_c0_g1_i1:34-360(+)
MATVSQALGAYVALVNLGAAGLFFYDKQQALAQRWRVPERTLQATALLGGWAGGFWAIHKFHHKSKKQSFLVPFYAATAANIAAVGAASYLLRKRRIGFSSPVAHLWS